MMLHNICIFNGRTPFATVCIMWAIKCTIKCTGQGHFSCRSQACIWWRRMSSCASSILECKIRWHSRMLIRISGRCKHTFDDYSDVPNRYYNHAVHQPIWESPSQPPIGSSYTAGVRAQPTNACQLNAMTNWCATNSRIPRSRSVLKARSGISNFTMLTA